MDDNSEVFENGQVSKCDIVRFILFDDTVMNKLKATTIISKC